MSAIKHINQRVAVFIDTQNLYHTAKHVYQGARVNFGNVVKDAVANRSLVRALAYVITTDAGDEKNFFQALEKMGIEIKTKELQTFVDGSKKADWDVALAIDAVRIAPRVDAVIIVSGDGDFVPLAEYLKQMGVQVEVICFGQSVSAKLQEAADIFTDISKDPDYFLINSANKKFQSQTRNFRNVGRGVAATPENSGKDKPTTDDKGENKKFIPRNLKESLTKAQEESIPLSDKHFTIVRKK